MMIGFSGRIRKTLAVACICILFSAIACLFWYKAWQYNLPAPVPPGYQPVPRGSVLPAVAKLNTGNKPLFLHFFNPSCPCSRFNIREFQQLAKQYSNQVQFAVVVMSNSLVDAAAIQKQFDLDIPVLTDSQLAKSCGVYSTPQAVLIGTDNRLYYRGNYNRARYCTDQRTNYAGQAIAGLLNNQKLSFDELALRAYGCSLPAANL